MERENLIRVSLALGVSKLSAAQNALVIWKPQMDQAIALFGRQAIQMVWDFAESNPFNGAAGDLCTTLSGMMRVLERLPVDPSSGIAAQVDATQGGPHATIISTDPPYFDNVPYADLSDFFYVWLRRLLKDSFPELFATVAVPKTEELVAFAYRHGARPVLKPSFWTA